MVSFRLVTSSRADITPELQANGFSVALVEQRLSPLAGEVYVYHLCGPDGFRGADTLQLRDESFRRILDHFYIPEPPNPVAASTLFDALATEYDRLIDSTLNVANIKRLLRALVVRSGESSTRPLQILDFGCGTGLSVIALAEDPISSERIRLVGTDSSTSMLRLASVRGLKVVPYTEWVSGYGGPFDGVIASYVLHCGLTAPEWTAMHSQIRPGGAFAANYHHADTEAIRRVAEQAIGFEMEPVVYSNSKEGSRDPLLIFRRR